MNSCILNCHYVADFQQGINWLNNECVHFVLFLTSIPSCGYKNKSFIPSSLVCRRRLNTTVAPLFYADQFLQMSTSLPTRFIYGLAEHRTTFLQDVRWNTLSMWARDEPPTVRENLLCTVVFCNFKIRLGLLLMIIIAIRRRKRIWWQWGRRVEPACRYRETEKLSRRGFFSPRFNYAIQR